MKRYLVALLALSVLLCACTAPELETEPVIQTETYAQTIDPTEPVPEITEAPETVPATTEPTQPLHSDLYHPGYTLEQIQDYFAEVILDVEYSDGTGDSSLVQKWIEPIRYRYFGTPTEEDLSVLEAFFTQLNELEGFPGLYPAEGETVETLRISFLEPDVFRDSFSSAVNGEDAYGAAQFWYYTDTNDIYTARIGYRTDLSQRMRNSILLEEIVNTLGVSDTLLREASITYQYTNENLVLSDVDWILLKLLYHPDMQCGMDRVRCDQVIARLYY